MNMRYAITKVEDSGLRVLATTNQARFLFDDPTTASEHLTAILTGTPVSTLAMVYGDYTAVRVKPVECYDSGEAKRTVFGFDEEKVK